MKFSTSLYYIEVKEGNSIKRVPHTKGKKYTDFINRQDAVKFLNSLVENYPRYQFRLCKSTTTETADKWQKK